MRNSFIYLLIGVAVIAIFFTMFGSVGESREIRLDEVMQMARDGDLESISVSGDKLTVSTTVGETFTSRKEQGISVVEAMGPLGVDLVSVTAGIDVKGLQRAGQHIRSAADFLPLIFFGVVLLFMMRQAQGNSSRPSASAAAAPACWSATSPP